MKAIIAIVLLALFAVAMAAEIPPPLRGAGEKLENAKAKVFECKKKAQDATGKIRRARESLKELKSKLSKVKTEADFIDVVTAIGLGSKLLGKIKFGKKKKNKKTQAPAPAEQPESDFIDVATAIGLGSKLLGKIKFGKKKKSKKQQPPAEQTESEFIDLMTAVGLGSKLLGKIKFGKKKKSKKQQPPAEQTESDSFTAKRRKGGKKNRGFAQDRVAQPAPAPQPEPAAPVAAEPEADTDATTDCGMAYQNGQQLGNKQCVLVQGKPVVVETAIAFEKLNAAAKAAGITLQVNSGFRTQKEQEYLYGCYQSKKCNNGNLAARPGYSNHQNGRAMDISCSNPKVFDWMRNNASKFGFIRTVASENWHWELLPGRGCASSVSYACK